MRQFFREMEFNHRLEQGNTDLMLAAADTDVDAVRHLIEQGADVNATNTHQQTALGLAVDLGYEYPDEVIQVIDLLLNHGGDINAQDNRGVTALMHAAFRGERAIVKHLLKRGADPNKQRDDGSPEGATLLSFVDSASSFRQGRKTIIKIIEQSGGIRNK